MSIPLSLLGDRAKRILLITHFLPPTHTAGTEQYTLGLGKTLKARGYEVTIICAEDWDTGDRYWNGVTQENLNGVLIYRIHLNWLKARNPNRILYESKIVENWLDQFLETHSFDIAHITSTYSLGVGIFRSIKRAGIPLILTLMDFWFLCPSLQLLRSDGVLCDGNTTAWQCTACLMSQSNFFQRVNVVPLPEVVSSRIWMTASHITPLTKQRGLRGLLLDMKHRKKLMKKVLELPDLIISPSKTVQTVFAHNSASPVHVLPYRHDLSWLREYRGKTESDTIRFGYLGQIHNVKGVHLLIEAFNKAQLGRRARLDIWGKYSPNTPYARKLISMIGDNDLISLHGHYDRASLGSILSEIDVILVPSIWYENAPLVIQEAFASRTPVIATNLGGMAEAVTHGVNGLLFERNNVNDLANQMRRVVEEPELLKELSYGIPSVKSFDQDILELELLYHQLIEENLSCTPLDQKMQIGQ